MKNLLKFSAALFVCGFANMEKVAAIRMQNDMEPFNFNQIQLYSFMNKEDGDVDQFTKTEQVVQAIKKEAKAKADAENTNEDMATATDDKIAANLFRKNFNTKIAAMEKAG